MKRFQKVNIEISNICNLQCSFCPPVVREKKVMSLDLFQRVMDQVAPLTEQVALHLMGDPLVHPQLDEILKICEKAQKEVFLVTNGVLLKRKEALLLKPIVRQVNFSLHSFPDNFPDEDPSQYLDTVFEFTEKAFQQRPELYINFRLWNLDAPVGKNDKNVKMLDRILKRWGNPDTIRKIHELDVRTQKSVRLVNRLYLHFDTEFIWPDLKLPEIGNKGTCYGLRSHFGILADGTVVPCCLDKEGVIPLGNLSEQPIQEILISPRAQKILNGFLSHKLEEELCKRCNYIERFKE